MINKIYYLLPTFNESLNIDSILKNFIKFYKKKKKIKNYNYIFLFWLKKKFIL